jgi:hypothetical protein
LSRNRFSRDERETPSLAPCPRPLYPAAVEINDVDCDSDVSCGCVEDLTVSFHTTENPESGGTDGRGEDWVAFVGDEEPLQHNLDHQEGMPAIRAVMYGFREFLLRPEVERIFGESWLKLSGSSASSLCILPWC